MAASHSGVLNPSAVVTEPYAEQVSEPADQPPRG
jgi:hypothetical protein